jgi:hypothetical protein
MAKPEMMMPSYEIKYDTTDEQKAKDKAIQDCKDWLGEENFAKLIKAFERDIASVPSPRQEIKLGLMMIGIQGYPAEVLIDTYYK